MFLADISFKNCAAWKEVKKLITWSTGLPLRYIMLIIIQKLKL